MIEREVLYYLLSDIDVFMYSYTNIKPSYFDDNICKAVFDIINGYFATFKGQPTVDVVETEAKVNSTNGFDRVRSGIIEFCAWYRTYNPNINTDYKKSVIEKWAKKSAMRYAVMKSGDLLSTGRDEDYNKIFDLVRSALSINFGKKNGLSLNNIEEWCKLITTGEVKYPFLVNELNKVTDFGFGHGLHIILASTGVGKSRLKCSLAVDYLLQGIDVAYYTMELGEAMIMPRIAANILNLDVKVLKNDYARDISKIAPLFFEKVNPATSGKFLVKNFPTGKTNMTDIMFFHDEMKIRTGFDPKIVFIDYIGNMSPTSGKKNLYEDGKYVAEEMRAFAGDERCVISSAQVNTEGMDGRITLKNCGESRAIAHTADFTMSLFNTKVANAQIDSTVQYIEVLKNRYSEFNNYPFQLTLDAKKFRLRNYDPEPDIKKISAPANINGINFSKRQ